MRPYASNSPFIIAILCGQWQRLFVTMPEWRSVSTFVGQFYLQMPDWVSWETMRETYARFIFAITPQDIDKMFVYP